MNQVSNIFIRCTDGKWHTLRQAKDGITCSHACSLFRVCNAFDEGEMDEFCLRGLEIDQNFGPACKGDALAALKGLLESVPPREQDSDGPIPRRVRSLVVVSGGRTHVYRRGLYSCDKCALLEVCHPGKPSELSVRFWTLCEKLFHYDGSFTGAGRLVLLDMAAKGGV